MSVFLPNLNFLIFWTIQLYLVGTPSIILDIHLSNLDLSLITFSPLNFGIVEDFS